MFLLPKRISAPACAWDTCTLLSPTLVLVSSCSAFEGEESYQECTSRDRVVEDIRESMGSKRRMGIICAYPLLAQDGKESACYVGDLDSIPGSRRFPWRRKWLPTPVFLLGKSHGQRSLSGYMGIAELDTTE